ncbi:Acylphosphatase-1 [Tetrabaena socialis]|uniref:acylphosphatase n=1 Tax=Tetrabaena socialis TaxID=47790 RepID=A0A2J7ZPX3_9CHLO|nr:Acylphosphatase-1 [Tetrabaena socialis]|eukprot:PNH02318.1 Acylphosphatase-1 [Tetrabaena socialis]
MSLVALKFEVFGKVFFRKYTAAEANRLGLHGWCENTPHGTVRGELEGPVDRVRQMTAWLQTTGSPHSRIDRAVFGEEVPIVSCTHPAFSVRR